MQLTDEETQMLEGEKGPAVRKAMEILVALGESFGAERLVKINNVHMAGSSVLVAEEAGTKFVEDIRNKGGAFVTRVTTNPTAVDPTQWEAIGIPEADSTLQTRLTSAYAGMGANTCNSCIPYLVGNSPRFGEHMAWGESSAVVYANSVCGARTNREGGPSGLASALTGRTPAYGFHLTENRYGKLLIRVETSLRDMTDYGTLGYFAGKLAGQDTPVFTGLPVDPTLEELKALSAALASAGSVSMFHAVGVTPEAPTLEAAFGGKEPSSTYVFDTAQKLQAEQSLDREPSSHVDWILVGCPNASVQEIREVADALAGKRVHKDVTLWVTTSGAMYAMAERNGYIRTIQEAGGIVVRETCPFLARSRAIAPKKGFKTLTTNSAKMAFYAPGQFGLPSHYGNLDRVMKAAIGRHMEPFMTDTFVLKGRRIVKGKARGEAVVTKEAISFNGGVDNMTGIVTEPGHELEGVNIAGKVLVFRTGKGSTGGSYKIYDMVSRGTAPLAFVQSSPEGVTTIGAIIGEIPVAANFDQDPTLVIRTGDLVELDADAGTVMVTRRR